MPIALTALTAEELQRRQVTRTLDLISYIPNLNGNNNTGLGSANVYYLRGVGSTESLAVFDPPVGTYVDEFYNARQNQNNFGFFDIERIEVLRGRAIFEISCTGQGSPREVSFDPPPGLPASRCIDGAISCDGNGPLVTQKRWTGSR